MTPAITELSHCCDKSVQEVPSYINSVSHNRQGYVSPRCSVAHSLF